jgi:hypothetical protein
VEHEDLTVAAGARADADRGHGHGLGDAGREIPRDAFQNEREDAGVGQPPRVVENALGFRFSPALHLNPPSALTDWGVRPMWPITGISACRSASIMGIRTAPPSSFTAWQPASTMKRAALCTASCGVVW